VTEKEVLTTSATAEFFFTNSTVGGTQSPIFSYSSVTCDGLENKLEECHLKDWTSSHFLCGPGPNVIKLFMSVIWKRLY